MKKTSIIFVLIVLSLYRCEIQAQENFTFISYNVLNFPNGQLLNRQDTLQKIIDHVNPDILFLQELKSEAGLNAIASESFSHLEGNFLAGEWIDQQSNPDTSWPLQQNVVYNADKFTLYEQNTVLTDYRDFNEFIFYFNSEELEANQDTAFLYTYITHLKSSQGSQNEQIRLEMVNDFIEYLKSIPKEAQVILAGDFNLYSSSELAYEALLSEQNHIVLEDPIDTPGNWTESSFLDKSIMTQSTRTKQIFNGASGGVDDRFDFMLCSSNMKDGSGGYQYIDNSYYALGNNGNCYNQNILDCADSNLTVPQSVMNALYYMSDHLPVIMKISLDQTSNVSEYESARDVLRSNVIEQSIEFNSPVNQVSIYNLDGGLVLFNEFNSGTLEISMLNRGVYVLKVDNYSPIKILKI